MHLNFLRTERKNTTSNRVKGLFSYGRSNFGLGPYVNEVNNFINIPEFETIVQYDVSEYHNLVVSSVNDQFLVWTFGKIGVFSGEKQEDTSEYEYKDDLNTSENSDEIAFKIENYRPKLINELTQYKITKVSCGFSHCLAVSESGILFSWGFGASGELGLGKDVTVQITPRQVTDLPDIFVADAFAGRKYTMILSNTGLLYSCGLNNLGQLGIGDIAEKIFCPVLVEFFKDIPIRTVSCGRNYVVAITMNSDLLYSWGYGIGYQLGHGYSKSENIPKLIDYFKKYLIKVKDVSCGSHHTATVTWDGLCYVWGSGPNGELGLGNKTVAKYPTLLTSFVNLSVKAVSLSHEYTIFLMDSGDVYVSGSGLVISFFKTSQQLPQKLELNSFYVLSLKTGKNHCLMYSDAGEMCRNYSIGKISLYEKLYLQRISFFCKFIMFAIDSVFAELSWVRVFGSLKFIFKFHYKNILKNLLNITDRITHTNYSISHIWVEAFGDKDIIRIYTNYALNFLDSWNMFLDCVHANPLISSIIQVILNNNEVSLINCENQNIDGLYAALSAPLNYFSNTIMLFDDLLRHTSTNDSGYSSILNLLSLFNEINSIMIGTQSHNESYIKMIEFVNSFPSCSGILLDHRRYVSNSKISITEDRKFDHKLYIFSDMIVIISDFDVKHKLSFKDFFFCECRPLISDGFMIFTLSCVYTVYFESSEIKNSTYNALEISMNVWMLNSMENKNSYITTIMKIFSNNLEIMTLITSNYLYKGKNRLYFKTDTNYKFNTNDFNDIIKGIKDIKDELVFLGQKAAKINKPEEKDQFIFFMNHEISINKFNSHIARKTKSSLEKDLISDILSKPSEIVRRPNANYRIAIYIPGDMNLETAKKILYERAKKSFWSRLIHLHPIADYYVRIHNFDYFVLDEKNPINSIPIIKIISQIALVNPYFELTLRDQGPNPFFIDRRLSINKFMCDFKFSFDSDIVAFQQLVSMFDDPRVLLKMNSSEVLDFRRKFFSLRNQLLCDQELFRKSELSFAYWNENKSGEPVASVLPNSLEICVTFPSITSGEYMINVSPYDTVESVYRGIYMFLYKSEKSKNKLTKFMKKIKRDSDSEDSSSDSEIDNNLKYKYAFSPEITSENDKHINLKTQKSIVSPFRSPIFAPLVKKLNNLQGKESFYEKNHHHNSNDNLHAKYDKEFEYQDGEYDKKNRESEPLNVDNDSDNLSNMEEGHEKLKRKEGEKLKQLNKEEKRLKKMMERNRRELEKVMKNQKKRLKKEDEKHRKEVEKETKNQKRLHNGKRISDFIIKIAGAKEYLIDYNATLFSYDYIRNCVSKKQKIEFKFIERSALDLHLEAALYDMCNNTLIDKVLSRVPVIKREFSIVNTNSYGDIRLKANSKDDNYKDDFYNIPAEEVDFYDLFLNSANDNNPRIPPQPFWALKKKKCSYSLKIWDFENIPECISAKYLFVFASIHYGNLENISSTISSFVEYSVRPVFNEVLTFDISFCNIPRESKLILILYARTEDNKQSEILDSDVSIAWISKTIYDYKGYFNSDKFALRMWPGKAHVFSVVSENYLEDENIPPIAYVEVGLFSYIGFSNKKNREFLSLLMTKKPVLNDSEKDSIPSESEKKILDDISKDDHSSEISTADFLLIWNYRYWCKNNKPEIIVNFLLNVDWRNRKLTSETHDLIMEWPVIPAIKSLPLLYYKCSDRISRKYCIGCLATLGNNELLKILMQLVQALVYEPYHFSDLAFFLIERSFWSPNLVGYYFFWFLKFQMKIPYFRERYSLIFEAFGRSCGFILRNRIIYQMHILDYIHSIAVKIRNSKRKIGRKTEKLKKLLSLISWPVFRYPLDSRYECNGFIIDECKVFGSKNFPLLLTVRTTERISCPLQMIYKIGDDLRQDFLIIQIIKLMDKLWKSEGLDLRLMPYECLYRPSNCGIIEVVKDSYTTSSINIELGGLRAVYNNTTLLKWLKKHNTTEAEMSNAIENFTYSCAGYSIITFILGLADRHNDNIMLTKRGHLFHIDFSRFFGNYRKVFGKYVDKADFVLLDQYYEVMKNKFNLFVEICCKAYNIIRKNSSLIINLFTLMTESGIPELESESDTQFIKDRLQLKLSNDEATEFFKKKIQTTMSNSTIKLNHAFHVVYHGMKN